MIVAAHQPHYMPWLGYLDKIAKADVFVLMDDLQFEWRNYQNRQRMKLGGGAAGWLTVPLVHGSRSERILDKRIAPSPSARQDWRGRHWRTLVASYANAPYFSRYASALRDVYARPWSKLVELDMTMLALAMRWFGIRTPVVRSSQLHLRGTKTDRLIDLCHKLGARCYLSGAGGSSSYLDTERMGRAGIGVIWQHFAHPVGFDQQLGYLDLLFHRGPGAHEILFGPAHPARLVTEAA